MTYKAGNLSEPAIKKIRVQEALAKRYKAIQRRGVPSHHKDTWFVERGLQIRKC
jgi:hypothetical protein